MAFLDSFSNPFERMNVFGAKAPSYMGGILDQNELEKLKQQSLVQGLLGTAATYLAQPKNQRYGSALPYLGKAFLGGTQASQGVYDKATQDYMTAAKIAEFKKSQEQDKNQEDAINKLLQQPDFLNNPLRTAAVRAAPKEALLQYTKPNEGVTPTELDKYVATVAKLKATDPTNPNIPIYEAAIKKATEPTQGSPFYQAVPTEQGYAAFDARTGKIAPLSLNGATKILPAAQSPTVQGAIKAAETTSTQQAKNEQAAQGTTELANRAANILKGYALDADGNVMKDAQGQIIKAPKPTSSYLGMAQDISGQVFGKSIEGSAEADQLKVIGGRLVSKVPRMEGPQSDRDVNLYIQMAGRVGDSSVPIENRLKALEEVKRITAKYEKLNPSTGTTNVQSNLTPLQLELAKRKQGGK
jgi:hypothetical protein